MEKFTTHFYLFVNELMNVIKINNLTFKYEDNIIFENLNLNLQEGKRYVLSGLNGCGKSTLLKIISGKNLSEFDCVKVLGKDPFRDTSSNFNIAYVSNDWGTRTVAYTGFNMPLQSSIKVKEMMVKLKEKYIDRANELLDVLSINPEWRLNSISDGQRKRVQLYLGLIQPHKICLLDEVTVNLDILVKYKFFNYLKKESEINNVCIIYVTHIFDGLNDWCTDLIYLKRNKEFIINPIENIINKNIYSYLLEVFSKEMENNEVEKEEMNKKSYTKNAGGYTNGVLIDYNIDKNN